jgi:hypothetical protein
MSKAYALYLRAGYVWEAWISDGSRLWPTIKVASGRDREKLAADVCRQYPGAYECRSSRVAEELRLKQQALERKK